MSFQEIIAWLRGSVIHIVILAIGAVSAWILVGKFKSGELSFGDTPLQQEVAKKEGQLNSLKSRLERKEEKLVTLTELKAKAVELEELNAELRELQASNLSAKGRLASLNEGLVQTEEMFDEYRQRYRKHIREKAVGTKMETLTIAGGKTYHSVEIKSVGALGVNITHKDGSRRIPFKELPTSMQKQFQFDEEEAEAQLRKEAERRRQFRLAQAAALREDEKQGATGSKPDEPKMTDAEIERAEDKLRSVINNLKSRINVAEANLRIERGKTISRAPQFRAELQELRQALKENESRLRDLRSKR